MGLYKAVSPEERAPNSAVRDFASYFMEAVHTFNYEVIGYEGSR